MVRIFSMYHFSGQLVDTVEEMSALTVTNKNKLLIAQDDYSVEVKDLLSDKKGPIFVFSTVEKVHKICHCAFGNYVATVEGKQAFQKSDRLIVRVYTNWEADFVLDESIRSSSYSKRLVRARIAGVVTPSNAKTDEDFLDMIEIPISFTSPILLTVCQNTGKLLITCGPTMHLFKQVYVRNHDKTPYFMDFVPLCEVFQLEFLPIEVTMSENIIASYSKEFVSVFRVDKLSAVDKEKLCQVSVCNNDESTTNVSCSDNQKKLLGDSLNVADIFKMVRENKEHQLTRHIDYRSLPLLVSLKGINDNIVSIRATRFPFKIFERKKDYFFENGKVQDTLVETLCEKDISVIARSMLALHVREPDEPVTKLALQVTCQQLEDGQCDDIFSEKNATIVSINILISTFQEGFLFHSSGDNLMDNLSCIAVFNFTSQVINVMFEVCFLHVLTLSGLEIYSVPSLHSTILHEKLDLDKFSHYISIIGMHPFIGIMDFVGSKDLIVIFTSADEGKYRKESFPWTVYSLKKPKLFEVYQEMIENSNSYKSRDDITYRYLSLESFLMLQASLDLDLTVCDDIDDALVRSTHEVNSMELAKIYFRSGNNVDVEIGSSVILAAKIDPIEFIQSIEIEQCDISCWKIFLMKKWIGKQHIMSENKVEWLIKMFEENDEISELCLFILSHRNICSTSGHKAIPCLRTYVAIKGKNTDILVIYTLVILYSQGCFQDDAVFALSFVQDGGEEMRKSFVNVVLKFWEFLFDEIAHNDKKKIIFSDLSSLLSENLPVEMAEILAELVLVKNVFEISDVVQMLMMQFPCHMSVQKGTFVLRSVLERVFASKMAINYENQNVDNCLMILARSYLNDLLKQIGEENEMFASKYNPIFVDQLPSFVDFLPAVKSGHVTTLRRFQELVWSKKLNEGSIKEIVQPLTNVNLRLNIMAMLNQSDFAKELLEHNCFDALLPYAKSSFNNSKKWKDFICFLRHVITELNESEKDAGPYEKVMQDILNHLALNLTPPQLNAILDCTISKQDELYWKYIVRAQQIAFANDVKELIINTSQQLLQSHPAY